MSPKVTVLLCTYNQAQYLKEALDSILNQTFTDFEVLVINDGSTDETASLLTTFTDSRLRVIHHETNQGVAASRNQGLAEAQGEYIAVQDADDHSPINRLAEQVALLNEHPEVVATSGWVQLIDSRGQSTRNFGQSILKTATDPWLTQWRMLFTNATAANGAMFRKAAATSGYDDLRYAEDYALLSRLSRHGIIQNTTQIVLYYRINPTGITQTLTCEDKLNSTLAVVQENLKDLLQEEIPFAVIQLLREYSFPYSNAQKDLKPDPITLTQVTQALLLYLQSYQAFLSRYRVPSESVSEIRKDLSQETGRLMMKLGYADRLRVLQDKRTKIPRWLLRNPHFLLRALLTQSGMHLWTRLRTGQML